MNNHFNSKRIPSRLEDLKRRAKQAEKELLSKPNFQSSNNVGNLDKFVKRYKAKESRILEEIDRMLEEPFLKDNHDKTGQEKREFSQASKRRQLSNKSSTSIQRAPTPNTLEYGLLAKQQTRQPLRPPSLTTSNWITLNADTREIVYGRGIYQQREVASLTKIMTCILTLDFIDKYSIDIDKTHYLVSKKAATLGGTTAYLRKDDYVCVRDLLYGLMLPSGNDAAQTLAENIITHRCILDKHKNCNPNELDYEEEGPVDKDLEAEFYLLMNKKAKDFKLFNTYYDSSHGLMNEDNYSCSYDQAVLAVEAMKHPLLQEIVQTTRYTALIERNERDMELIWVNTNKLLEKRGYKGLKTGVTKAAGGCLSTAYSAQGRNFVTIVLGCRDVNARFTDSEAINTWIDQNYKEIMELPLEERFSR